MAYILLNETGEVQTYPYSITDLRRDNPDTSFGEEVGTEALADFGVFWVDEVEAPEVLSIERLERGDPVIVDGQWTETWSIKPLPLVEAKAVLLRELADKRWRCETSGITVQGMPIKTDRESQGLLSTVYFKAKIDPSFSVQWKADQGLFVSVTGAQLVQVGDAVFGHVQACFAREGQITALIKSASTFSALKAIDINEGWPS